MSRFTWAPGWSGWITARSRAMRPTRLWRARFRQSVRTWRANAGFRPGIPCWTAWQYWGATPTDRKSVVEGKSVDLGGRRIIKKIIFGRSVFLGVRLLTVVVILRPLSCLLGR